ncbi:MAG TPA: LuxR C-terminal-related transcriptional regulator [Candidatus Acidoferrum sp.]|nr:LuxR C-terminal-related transcriptional regulator [Candidatus Acidoferrum sp.]
MAARIVAVAGFSARGEPEALSSREHEVLRYLVRGYTFAEAARSLGLRVSKLERLRAGICKKLDVRDRPTVYEYAVAIGLVGPNGKA